MTLSDALRMKENDIVLARAAGEDIIAHAIVRKSLHALVSATNRRMHKCFPEMCRLCYASQCNIAATSLWGLRLKICFELQLLR